MTVSRRCSRSLGRSLSFPSSTTSMSSRSCRTASRPSLGDSTAASVNVTTKSGTSAFHGEVYEFLRNEAMNARNYFTPTTSAKPIFRRNQYGGALSGPVLPQRLFFFADYQGTNQAVGVVRTSTVPTRAQRGNPDANGNPTTGFNFGTTTIYDPATTVQTGRALRARSFQTTRFRVNRVDPAALALLARYPLPTSSCGGEQLCASGQ